MTDEKKEKETNTKVKAVSKQVVNPANRSPVPPQKAIRKPPTNRPPAGGVAGYPNSPGRRDTVFDIYDHIFIKPHNFKEGEIKTLTIVGYHTVNFFDRRELALKFKEINYSWKLTHTVAEEIARLYGIYPADWIGKKISICVKKRRSGKDQRGNPIYTYSIALVKKGAR